MGFRFRKSFGKGPFRMTISKSGIGYSVGGKGARFTKKAGGGTRTTLSVPGTGISYTKDSSKHRTKKTSSANSAPIKTYSFNNQTNSSTNKEKNYIVYSDERKKTKNYKKLLLNVWAPRIGLFFLIFAITFFGIVFTEHPLFALGFYAAFLLPILIIKRPKYKQYRQILSKELYRYKTPIVSWDSVVPLQGEKLIGYLQIIDFLTVDNTVNFEKEFSLSEINSTLLTNTISQNTFTFLFNEGFLIKPARGRYKINQEKYLHYENIVKSNYDIRMEEYNNFAKQLEAYNQKIKINNDKTYFFHTS
jgi:hypothetical protein